MYEQLKIALIGTQWLDPEVLTQNLPPSIEILPLSDAYPLEKLDYLGPIHTLILNVLEMGPALIAAINQVRAQYPELPILAVLSDQHLAVDSAILSKAGVTDYLFPQFETAFVGELLQQHCEAYATKTRNWKDKLLDQRLRIIPTELAKHLQRPKKCATATINIQFFGPLTVHIEGRLVNLPRGQKPRSILAYLLSRAPQRPTRTKLIQQFWPDTEVASASNNLSVQIHHIKKQLGHSKHRPIIHCEQEAYFLHPDWSVESDLHLFQRYYERGKAHERTGAAKLAVQAYQQAVALYRGDFLEDLFSESWTVYRRENVLERYYLMLSYMANWHFEQQLYAEAAEYWKRILQKDNAIEKAHRRLIQCYLSMGRTAKAIRQYEACKTVLYDYLRRRPEPATTALVKEWV